MSNKTGLYRVLSDIRWQVSPIKTLLHVEEFFEARVRRNQERKSFLVAVDER